jgi:hypothetical protein
MNSLDICAHGVRIRGSNNEEVACIAGQDIHITHVSIPKAHHSTMYRVLPKTMQGSNPDFRKNVF